MDDIGAVQLVEDAAAAEGVSMRSGSQQAESAEPAAHRVGTLISVNVGMPKDVPWQEKTIFTEVFKDPVAGGRRVRKLNVDGDGQGDLAGHGGEQRAVFVYQLDSYRYWERELGRNDFVYGQFGENFTIEGLRDDGVCIGDRGRRSGWAPGFRYESGSWGCEGGRGSVSAGWLPRPRLIGWTCLRVPRLDA